ncbi:hypothetical protein Patl1_32087 [Pistacia atlantica]|uniref:Uncharacterized protein n=1 Tax=Pistacia atlantica TaxID=434234 RepID=A0ACC1ART6_9ROSI|nr:hypothetical protein Patl1_32087 [Pistacia atlantica]
MESSRVIFQQYYLSQGRSPVWACHSIFSEIKLIHQILLIIDHYLLYFSPFAVSRLNQERMAANRGQGGIQQLLAAEQEAQHIVNAARAGSHTIH